MFYLFSLHPGCVVLGRGGVLLCIGVWRNLECSVFGCYDVSKESRLGGLLL